MTGRKSFLKGGVLAKILTLSLVLVLLGLATQIASILIVSQRISNQIKQSTFESAQSDVTNSVAMRVETAGTVALAIAENPTLQPLFAAGDREALLKETKPVFDALKKTYKVKQLQFHTPEAHSFLRVHKPEKFGDDLSAFRHTVVEANKTKQIVGSAEGGVAGMGIRAVVPVTYQGQHLGTVEIGLDLGEGFAGILGRSLRAPVGLYALGKDAKPGDVPELVAQGSLPESYHPSDDLLLKSAAGEPLSVEGVIGDTNYQQVFVPIKDFRGTPVAVAVALFDTSAADKEASSAFRVSIILGVIFALVSILLAVLVSRSIGKSVTVPVKKVADVLDVMSRGDFSARAPIMGDISVQTLAQRLNSTIDNISASLAQVREATVNLDQQLDRVSALSIESEQTARNALDTAGQVSSQADNIVNSINVVASATEEMSASIREISHNTTEVAGIGTQAVEQAEQTNTQMEELGQSSQEIGEVISLISSIAEQTNLLALNATIESARAGEAGKGFAVVAGEVKDLAQQTATATEDISRRINDIQDSSQNSVDAIHEVVEIIEKINEFQTAIASAVEEQTATTQEITSSVMATNQAVQEISSRAEDLLRATETSSQGAAEAQSVIEEAKQTSHRVTELLSKFQIKASESAQPQETKAAKTQPGETSGASASKSETQES